MLGDNLPHTQPTEEVSMEPETTDEAAGTTPELDNREALISTLQAAIVRLQAGAEVTSASFSQSSTDMSVAVSLRG